MPLLTLPVETDYLLVETDSSANGWGAVLKRIQDEYASPKTEEICRYGSGKFKEKSDALWSLDYEILAVGYALDSFRLFFISKKIFTLRTDCDATVKY